ncbi:MAG: methionyl-tRNA formyltransferase [Candidatus Magasanikbacteria bacterium CG10_big_fil_rev_8_21_14_0_10_43_6]|uniref:Methionyl-tRNA formyltransferase n=1 Tax=Candidatus Magasanikbacteria bacterium CG10_big_fil_rev_8_21_14_0_10_43_6 TaxID=1974650 RepID=A0A2M6W173_9BACT|nr:MAG: methionyl-tRNA formyltransferase [Candidatus Magasanikbacteria bacterium CG10_big_fil_rev_8_21_14_0_10_43_6]
MNTYVVVTIKSWNIENFEALKKHDTEHRWVLITDKKDLTLARMQELNPRYIFFPHWSWIIPPAIFEAYECIVFHMTDLPYGRGGSPLQNLIVRGYKTTTLSAIRVVQDYDAGDVYMKEDLSLDGTAQDILKRVSDATFRMIPTFVDTEPTATPQAGEVVLFERRKPSDGNIAALKELGAVYDYIRMLDAEGYPPAFIETETLRCTFTDAEIRDGRVNATVSITLKQT